MEESNLALSSHSHAKVERAEVQYGVERIQDLGYTRLNYFLMGLSSNETELETKPNYQFFVYLSTSLNHQTSISLSIK